MASRKGGKQRRNARERGGRLDFRELERVLCAAADAISDHFQTRTDFDALWLQVPLARWCDDDRKAERAPFFDAFFRFLGRCLDSFDRIGKVTCRLHKLLEHARPELVRVRARLQDQPGYKADGTDHGSASAALATLALRLCDSAFAIRGSKYRKFVTRFLRPGFEPDSSLAPPSDLADQLARYVLDVPALRKAWPEPSVLLRDALAETQAAYRRAEGLPTDESHGREPALGELLTCSRVMRIARGEGLNVHRYTVTRACDRGDLKCTGPKGGRRIRFADAEAWILSLKARAAPRTAEEVAAARDQLDPDRKRKQRSSAATMQHLLHQTDGTKSLHRAKS